MDSSAESYREKASGEPTIGGGAGAEAEGTGGADDQQLSALRENLYVLVSFRVLLRFFLVAIR